MKWVKIGRIFDPSQHVLPNGCTEYAQSPQALVLNDCIRIYFSTRIREQSGRYLSHIAYVDFDRSMARILGVSPHVVIPLGNLGSFDEHGIFPMNVLQHDGKIYAYTSGWSRRISVSVETSIGLATSLDQGQTFQRVADGPILTSSLNEPFLVGDPFVAVHQNVWHMWYIFGTRWIRGAELEHSPARVYKIGHATSNDGAIWLREGIAIIADRLNEDECQALPSVIKIQNKYHMVFCYREATDFRANKARGYRLGYAYSDDLIKWTRNDEDLGIGFSDSGWDSDMMCYPHLFQCDGIVYLLYNGNEFGRGGFGLARLECH